jgi:hypothetical protein
MSAAGFDLAVPGRERPQTHALDRAATGIGGLLFILINIDCIVAHYVFL